MLTITEINNHIENGGTVVIASYTKPLLINKKVSDRFRKSGYEVIKQDADGRGFRVQSGKSSLYVFAQSVILR